MQHHLLAVGTNIGMAILTLNQYEMSSAAPLPATVTNQLGGSAEIGVVVWMENRLWHKEYISLEEVSHAWLCICVRCRGGCPFLVNVLVVMQDPQ